MRKKILMYGILGILSLGTATGVYAANKNTVNTDTTIAQAGQNEETDDTETNVKDVTGNDAEENDAEVNDAEEKDVEVNDAEENDAEVNDSEETAVTNVDVKLTEKEATKIALDSVDKASKVIKVELEDENGAIVYTFDISSNNKKMEVNVDANTGKIVSGNDDQEEN